MTIENDYLHPLDIERAAKEQWGPDAKLSVDGEHLYDWRAIVDGQKKPIDMERAVRDQYGSAWTLVAVGVHRYDWRAANFGELKPRVLPVVPIASDLFFDVEAVRQGLECYRSVLLGVQRWYLMRAGATFCLLQSLIIPTQHTAEEWNDLSQITTQAGHRYDLFDAAVEAYLAHLPDPKGRLKVALSPFSGNSIDYWWGAAGQTGGTFLVVPQRATSVQCPDAAPYSTECANSQYAFGHELGHTLGLDHHSCEVYAHYPNCSDSIMESATPPDAVLLPPEIRLLCGNPFLCISAIAQPRERDRVCHIVTDRPTFDQRR